MLLINALIFMLLVAKNTTYEELRDTRLYSEKGVGRIGYEEEPLLRGATATSCIPNIEAEVC